MTMWRPNGERRRPVAGAGTVGTGWQVFGWAGDHIGEVIGTRPGTLIVRLDSIEARQIDIPEVLVSEADLDGRRVALSVDTSELDGIDPTPRGGVGLVGGPR